MVPPGQTFSEREGYSGLFRCNLWHGGDWVEVVVSDEIPLKHNTPVFVQSASLGEMWPSLLEKCCSKLYGERSQKGKKDIIS